jgi:hypothetical protein
MFARGVRQLCTCSPLRRLRPLRVPPCLSTSGPSTAFPSDTCPATPANSATAGVCDHRSLSTSPKRSHGPSCGSVFRRPCRSSNRTQTCPITPPILQCTGGENALRGDVDALPGAGCRGKHLAMARFPRQPAPQPSPVRTAEQNGKEGVRPVAHQSPSHRLGGGVILPTQAARGGSLVLWDPEDQDPEIETGPTVADQSPPHRAGSVVASSFPLRPLVATPSCHSPSFFPPGRNRVAGMVHSRAEDWVPAWECRAIEQRDLPGVCFAGWE